MMKGHLTKEENVWYVVPDDDLFAMLRIYTDGSFNYDLLYQGREVKYELLCKIGRNGEVEKFAIPMPDGDSWEKVFNEFMKQIPLDSDPVMLGNLVEWLKDNYNPPTEKQ